MIGSKYIIQYYNLNIIFSAQAKVAHNLIRLDEIQIEIFLGVSPTRSTLSSLRQAATKIVMVVYKSR
mgnify:CR=1 FL=1